MTDEKKIYKWQDYKSDQNIRWCPGCGDYSILSQVQRVFADIGRPPHEFAVISGIGCSSRFPYYMNTYGFHTIHGRAPSFATGVKLANPQLSVWQITGDGDGLSIGGNHLLHVLRRNVDLQILLFNNRIYGLTKGQYSPTSEVNKITKSTPKGSVDHPIEPCVFAMGADASFVARTLDINAKHQRSVLLEAYEHKGTSFVEIYQNCNIFNDGAFASLTDKESKGRMNLFCIDGQPLIFGGKNEPQYGIRMSASWELESVELSDNPTEEELQSKSILIHDVKNRTLGNLLARLQSPVAMGVLYKEDRPTYEEEALAQVELDRSKQPDITKALYSGQTWVVA